MHNEQKCVHLEKVVSVLQGLALLGDFLLDPLLDLGCQRLQRLGLQPCEQRLVVRPLQTFVYAECASSGERVMKDSRRARGHVAHGRHCCAFGRSEQYGRFLRSHERINEKLLLEVGFEVQRLVGRCEDIKTLPLAALSGLGWLRWRRPLEWSLGHLSHRVKQARGASKV
jgi:hypothetical protein